MTDHQLRSLQLDIASAALARAMAAEKEYRSTRLTIAVEVYTRGPYRTTADAAVRLAEQIMAANQSAPIPPEVLAQHTPKGSPNVA